MKLQFHATKQKLKWCYYAFGSLFMEFGKTIFMLCLISIFHMLFLKKELHFMPFPWFELLSSLIPPFIVAPKSTLHIFVILCYGWMPYRACLDSWKWEKNEKWENSLPTFLVRFEPEMGNGKIPFPFPFSFLYLPFILPFSHLQGVTFNFVKNFIINIYFNIILWSTFGSTFLLPLSNF